jgi:preprotein translocase subunit SecE
MKKIAKFFIGVKKEMIKVRWPKKKEMVTYSIATIIFVIFFALFFSVLDVTIAGLKTLVR